MAELKKHLTLSDQVAKLESRGLIISDQKEAEAFLYNTNYYRLTGYLHGFRKPNSDSYVDGIEFNQIMRIYEFDRKFARIVMFALEDVEETLKARLSYTITNNNPEDPTIYLRPNIYREYDAYIKFLSLFYKEVDNNSNLPFVKHHIDKYNGMMPMWVAVELFTMGNISALYKNLAPKYQKELSKAYGTGPVQLENWIENLTYTRNHIAHYMRIFNFNFGRTPKKCKYHNKYPGVSNMIFDQLCVASYMYSDSAEWNEYVIEEIEQLIDEYVDCVSLKNLGFPSNWKAILSV